jgi:hypothetical protein
VPEDNEIPVSFNPFGSESGIPYPEANQLIIGPLRADLRTNYRVELRSIGLATWMLVGARDDDPRGIVQP